MRVPDELFTPRGQILDGVATAARFLRVAMHTHDLSKCTALTPAEADALSQHAAALTEFVAALPTAHPCRRRAV